MTDLDDSNVCGDLGEAVTLYHSCISYRTQRISALNRYDQALAHRSVGRSIDYIEPLTLVGLSSIGSGSSHHLGHGLGIDGRSSGSWLLRRRLRAVVDAAHLDEHMRRSDLCVAAMRALLEHRLVCGHLRPLLGLGDCARVAVVGRELSRSPRQAREHHRHVVLWAGTRESHRCAGGRRVVRSNLELHLRHFVRCLGSGDRRHSVVLLASTTRARCCLQVASCRIIECVTNVANYGAVREYPSIHPFIYEINNCGYPLNVSMDRSIVTLCSCNPSKGKVCPFPRTPPPIASIHPSIHPSLRSRYLSIAAHVDISPRVSRGSVHYLAGFLDGIEWKSRPKGSRVRDVGLHLAWCDGYSLAALAPSPPHRLPLAAISCCRKPTLIPLIVPDIVS